MLRNKSDDGVHRLLDMVVEEVSLVDRAANQHRFLLVKRNARAQKTTQVKQVTQKNTLNQEALRTLVDALLGLADGIELIDNSSADPTESEAIGLANDLKSATIAFLQSVGLEDPTPNDWSPQTVSEFLQLIRSALEGASNQLAISKSQAHVHQRELGGVQAMLKSMRALTDCIKSQQTRLTRLEKHFGLPNSQRVETTATKVKKDTGWPLDLNQPFDKNSIDASLSFHDL